VADLGLRISADDGIATLTLDRPPLNVFDMALLHAFADAVDDLGKQPDLRLIVLRGNGKAFSAGVDVGEHLGAELAPMLEAFSRAATRLLASEVPTLAVAHGAVLGGACELAAIADMSLVADDAVVGCPEIRLGVVPPVAAVCFPRLIGQQRAAALILTGDTITGAEASRIGLLGRSVPRDQLETEAAKVIDRFRGLSASALRLARRTLRGADRKPLLQAIVDATDLQVRSIPEMADAQEGLHAFIEKRSPVWSHR
jgi:cyclohexa-1,5-dienecarbonyl-CoA hydratase